MPFQVLTVLPSFSSGTGERILGDSDGVAVWSRLGDAFRHLGGEAGGAGSAGCGADERFHRRNQSGLRQKT